MALTDKFVPKSAATVGQMELVINDTDGTPKGRSARVMVVLKAADGETVHTRYGDPQEFMSDAWKLKVKQVLDELRAEVATRVL